MITGAEPGMAHKVVEGRVVARVSRQRVLTRPDPLRYHVILDESVLDGKQLVAAEDALRKTRELLAARQVEIVLDDAYAYLKRATERFDVVFLDPPFGQNVLPAVLRNIKPGGGMRVYVESGEPVTAAAPWRELRRQRAGEVSYQLLEWRADDQGGLPGNV